MTDIDALADEFVTAMFDADPVTPAVLGVPSPRAGLADVSVDAEQAHRARMASLSAQAAAIDAAELDREQRLTHDVLIGQAEGQIALIDSRSVEFTVTDLFVAPAAGLLAMLPMITVATDEQAEAQLARLAAVPRYLEQAAERHRGGIASNLTPVRHLVDGAIAQLDRYLAGPAAEPLLGASAANASFATSAAEVVDDLVRPAFAAYRAALARDIAPHGRPGDRPGLCYLPAGEQIYSSLTAWHTTTGRTAGDLHSTGLNMMDELADEYRELGARVFGTSDIADIFHRLRTDTTLRFKTADEMLDAARGAVARAETQAEKWFGRLPSQRCVVEAVPAVAAPGSPAAYYVPPAQDGSRPGTYFVNTHQASERFRYAAEALAFHEAVPGHHLQLGIALGLEELPLLRRLGGFNAYVEGWGLYSERLADEMGLYTDDVARLGMLAADSLRIGRLVTDTGLHALGWSRDKAIGYLIEHTPIVRSEIEVEVDRYIGCPAQALSYMVGRLEIQRLRTAAEEVRGPRFDIAEFHDAVLASGAVPLPVLGRVVMDWAAS